MSLTGKEIKWKRVLVVPVIDCIPQLDNNSGSVNIQPQRITLTFLTSNKKFRAEAEDMRSKIIKLH